MTFPTCCVVVIYSSDLLHIQNITGDQIGAYFGYTLTVLDIDGDGLDDLVIGAPMYTDFDDPAMKIETGRVYVIYQSRQHHFGKFESIDGTAHKGRFGLSLASCGDMNKDGFNDFAVGAPYDGIYGRGAVYIYHGSSTGVRKEYTQVIYGEELSHTVSTFGFSLSGGKDLDGNQYPDLIVGAYESDVVAYFRSKPVVRVKSKLSFPQIANKQINLDEKECTLRDRTSVTCTQLSICMEYDGVGADDVIDFNVQYTLDAKKPKDSRMFFLNHEGRNVLNETVRLTKKKQVCSSQQVYLRPQIRDKLTSLEAELRYSMRESRYHERRELPPVIDITTSSVEKESISIQKNCGSDNICVPNLIVKVNQSDRSFLMGSTKRIWVEVEVANNGEDSYETMLYMSVPQGLSYVNFDRLDTSKDVPILCSAPTPSTNNTLRCDIGNPLPFHSKARLRVFFQPRYGSEIKSSYDFLVEANSTNPEDIHKRGDNLMPVRFPIRVQTDMKVFGVSDPQPVRHNATLWKKNEEKDKESDIGPEVTHIYELKCEGPSDIEEAEVRILWPSYTLAGQHFVYLLEQPLVDGPAECDHVDDVNPLALTLSRKSKWQSRRVEQHHEEHHHQIITTGGGIEMDLDTEEALLRREQQGGYSRSSSSSSGGFRTSSSGVVHGGTGISGENTYGSSSSSTGGVRTGGGTISTGNVHGQGGYGTISRHSGGAGTYIAEVRPGAAGSGFLFWGERVSSGSGIHSGGERVSSGSGIYSGGERVSSGSGIYSGGERVSSSSSGSGSYSGGERVSSSSSGSGSYTGDTYSRSGGGYVDGGGAAGSSGSYSGGTYSRTGGGYVDGDERYSGGERYGVGGSGYQNRNSSSQHEYRREHSLGGGTGSSGGYSSAYNYSRTISRTEYSRAGTGAGSGSSLSTGDGDEYQESYFNNRNRRHKRASEDDPEKEMGCGPTRCTRIRCHIKHFPKNSSVIFMLRGRIFSDTLVQEFHGDSVNVSSKLVTWVTKLPYNVDPTYLRYRKYEIDTTIEELPDLSVPAPIPWWVYFLAALAGVLLLLLIVYIFYKCGFFKRRRRPSGPEGQPLNRY
ncbi:Integrin alpha-PS2 [Orchesella cincta]|uniref:Integrin alpha-PS2 n=1 Tax=Orchesella cincta TaxID=48709 RepID=A0A1D2MPE1_ORCCI|nr:Integrin alpha-PS2 [Orchesella cincta]